MVANGILTSFLLPEDFYAEDVKKIASQTIENYGIEEWKLVVMTNEIHGHLGIYSTIGAKMGLYARECFAEKGGKGEISVVTFAGTVPPISCTNDGLQISTGATVGHGLITVSDEEQKRVEAIFTCKEQSLRLKIKSEYIKQIKSDIQHGIAMYGHTPSYWQYVRELSIKYWSGWNRKEIFDVID